MMRNMVERAVPSALTFKIANNKRAGTARSTIILLIQMYRYKHAAIMRKKVNLAYQLSEFPAFRLSALPLFWPSGLLAIRPPGFLLLLIR